MLKSDKTMFRRCHAPAGVAGRWWNEMFLTFIVGEPGFEVSDFRPSFLFRREIDAPPTLLLSIIDDTPIAGAPHHVAAVRARISARFVFI